MRGPNTFTTQRARSLRQAGNEAEAALWTELRNRCLNDCKFFRQLPIGPYFADFACRERLLVVELDGSQHAHSRSDRARDAFMNSEGWSVLRFWNFDVFQAREAVLNTIRAALEHRLDRCIVASDMRFMAAPEYRETSE